jgi:hypothetical protein
VKVRKWARSRQRPKTPIRNWRGVVDRARKKKIFFFHSRAHYGTGCHNPSGLPITFHHLKASLKHVYFFNATAILLM